MDYSNALECHKDMIKNIQIMIWTPVVKLARNKPLEDVNHQNVLQNFN